MATVEISYRTHAEKPSLTIEVPDEIDVIDRLKAAVEIAVRRGIDLGGADLSHASLGGADLGGAKNAALAMAMATIVPAEGEIIGWKKAGNAIVKLRVPPEAKRSNAAGRKCRAEFVEVLEVHGAEAGITDRHGPRTEYRAGETVRADRWDEDRWNECSHGIHFWLTREEAEAW